jgi:type VI secretion system protein ImpM
MNARVALFAVCGLFGKLPAHGDFIRRGLPGAFLDPWDAWLSAAMLAMEAETLTAGDDWPLVWASAPALRFHLPPGACGPLAAAGVLLPSMDSVGRRFPLTLAAVAAATPAATLDPESDWYAALEALGETALDGLEADMVFTLLPPAPAMADKPVGSCHFWHSLEGLPNAAAAETGIDQAEAAGTKQLSFSGDAYHGLPNPLALATWLKGVT